MKHPFVSKRQEVCPNCIVGRLVPKWKVTRLASSSYSTKWILCCEICYWNLYDMDWHPILLKYPGTFNTTINEDDALRIKYTI
jgi:hypothetical protein